MDYRRKRSAQTRRNLMLAAEKLIAENGIENVTIRQIIGAAGQKNESALQYHFGNRKGLIDALLEERSAEIGKRRADMLDALLAECPRPSLRQVACLLVRPTFDLAASRPEFLHFIRAFGHELALTEFSALAVAARRENRGEHGGRVSALLRASLSQLGTSAYQRRMDSAIRLVAAAMSNQSRQQDAFRGAQGHLFLHSLIDALVGLLGAPESDQTRKVAQALTDDGAGSAPADATHDAPGQ